ncbi:hypothetical protein Tco_0355004 [Tanacetum coccineum]
MESKKYLEGQSMQRPLLFESDEFIYWKNRFETYVKSKDLDLWHIITYGDFPPIQNNPETKKDEIVPFEKQSDDLKKKLPKIMKLKCKLNGPKARGQSCKSTYTLYTHGEGGGWLDSIIGIRADWFKKPEQPLTPDPDWSKRRQVDFRPPQTWISQVAHAEEPPTSFHELNDTSFDFSALVINRLKILKLTQEILVGLAFNLLKGTCKSITELEYHLEECSKATTE